MNIDDLADWGIPHTIIETWHHRGLDSLTQIQAAAFTHPAFRSDINIILVAPTSSGKTFVGEVAAVLTALEMRRAIYLVPMKAIADEKYRDFREAYGNPQVGLQVVISSGDHPEFDADILVGNFDLAIIVYEKFSQLLVQAPELLGMCGLIVVDELQLVRDGSRGPKLELLLTRILMAPQHPKILGLSATMKDLNGLDEWLRAEVIASQERPVPLLEGICNIDGRITWYSPEGTTSVEQSPLSSPCHDTSELLHRLVEAYSRYQQILIFVSTKDATREVAQALCRVLPSFEFQRAVADEVDLLDDTEFKGFMQREGLAHRVGYHNADLDPDERILAEMLFKTGGLKVIVCTTTLAMGVNLPSDLVIVRDVERWGPQGRVAIPTSEYKNAAGRAGRLGSRTEGRALLLAGTAFEGEQLSRNFIFGPLEEMDSAIPSEQDFAFHVLSLIASQLAQDTAQAQDVFKASYAFHVFYHEYSHELATEVSNAIAECISLGLVEDRDGLLRPSRLGLAVARAGIGISTYRVIRDAVEEASAHGLSIPALLFRLLQSREATGLAPYLRPNERDADTFRPQYAHRSDISTQSQLSVLLSQSEAPTREEDVLLKRVLLLLSWIEGNGVRDLETFFRIGLGALRTLGETTSWITESAARLAPLLGASAETSPVLSHLSDELRYGVPFQMVPLAQLRARGLGRDTLLRLIHNEAGLVVTTPDALFDTPDDSFKGVISPRQLHALRDAALASMQDMHLRHQRAHSLRLARAAPFRELVDAAYRAAGTDFERAIEDLLTTAPVSLDCVRVSRQRHGEEDLHLRYPDGVLIIQATASQDQLRNVRWEKAREVLAQGVGLNPIGFVVIGKPDFHDLAILNAERMRGETGRHLLLLPFFVLAELCVQVVEGHLSSDIFRQLLRTEVGHLSLESVTRALTAIANEVGASKDAGSHSGRE